MQSKASNSLVVETGVTRPFDQFSILDSLNDLVNIFASSIYIIEGNSQYYCKEPIADIVSPYFRAG